MSNSGFTLLWSKILDSSVWMESKETRLVWITMLAMKDSEGMVFAAVNALAHRARVTEPECEGALKIFLEPDARSSSQVEEGRRIKVVPGGWQIINHDQYRFSTQAKREFWRAQKAEQREQVERTKKRKLKRGTPLAGEMLYERTGQEPHEFREVVKPDNGETKIS